MKKLHRLLSLLVVATVGLGCVAGCGPKGSNINYDLTETTEKISYNFFSPGFYDLAENDSVVAYIENRFNVDIKFDGGASGDWQKALTGLISTNKAPDMFFALPNSSSMSDYTRKTLTDFDYYLDNAGDKLPNLKAMLNAKPFGADIKINGKYYFVPRSVGTSNRAILVRKDWMQQWNESRGKTGTALNDAPVTLSEFTNMLNYFHDQSLGGGKTYGMAIGIDNFDFYKDFMSTFGITPDFYIDANGDYQYSALTDPRYEDFIKWFQDGVGTYIDETIKDGQSAAGATQAFIDNQVGAIICNSVGILDGLLGDLENLGRDIDEVAMLIAPPDSDDGQYQGRFFNFNFYWGGFVVSKNVKEPMRMMKILDFLVSAEGQKLLTYGIKDTHYTEDEHGVITPIVPARRAELKSWGGNGRITEADQVSGRHVLGSQFYPCPFKVVNGEMVEDYPKYVSVFESYFDRCRELAAENNVCSALKGLIPSPDISKYNAEILDALETYTINRIMGDNKQDALDLLNLSLGKKDTVLNYINKNLK